MPDLDQN